MDRAQDSNVKRRATVRIGPDDNGISVLDFLERRFTYHTRQQWRELIAEDRVQIDGAPADPDQPLTTGNRLEYIPRHRPEPPVHTDFRIVHEDDAGDPRSRNYAKTIFRRIRTWDGLSLVEAQPVTGRLHQIRASLCSLGFPVAGDKLYGVDDTLYLRFIHDELTDHDRHRLRYPRQALHAADITLSHPASGRRIHLEAPFPDDLR